MIAQERGNDREESVSQIDSGAKRARSSILFYTIARGNTMLSEDKNAVKC